MFSVVQVKVNSWFKEIQLDFLYFLEIHDPQLMLLFFNILFFFKN